MSKDIQRIDFQQNWNNKLLCEVFTTIRPASNKYDLAGRYAIYLRDKFFCYADILSIDKFTLQEIIDKKIHLIDTGKNEKFFLELMEGFYNKKSWWKGSETPVNVIYLKKIIQTNLFDQIN